MCDGLGRPDELAGFGRGRSPDSAAAAHGPGSIARLCMPGSDELRESALLVLAETAHQLIRVPPAAVSLADGLEFVLRVRRRDRDAAASDQEGQGDRDECCSAPHTIASSSQVVAVGVQAHMIGLPDYLRLRLPPRHERRLPTRHQRDLLIPRLTYALVDRL